MHYFSGSRLREFRERAGLRVIDVAYLNDINPSTVSLWENGRRCPNANSVARLAEFFHVSTDLFYEVAEPA